ncbi:MAG: NAD(P)H-binding protein, partial [Rhodobacteraceae bacterium]|nr:NAD(P)H-binding protein [Paracoccaceae bacterium]
MVSVVMLGASGAVGGEALRVLQAMPEITRITLLNRRALRGLGEKVGEHILDVADPAQYRHLLAGHDAALCTLGVGEPSKASRAEFTRIDHDMPLAFAKACAEAGVAQFSLLSAVGVTARSRIFYIRTKGELEDALRALGFA